MRGFGGACLAVLLAACGNTATPEQPDAGATGSGSGGSAQHLLHLRVTGNGEVRSDNPSLSCRNDCQQSLDGAATVHLVARPDSGWKFDGWQGACSGTAACDLAMGADHDVSASFSTQAPPPSGSVRVSVIPVGTGAGRVTSSPTGIDCPGACAMTVAAGTAVTLMEQPAATSTFAGWGAGCSGGGGCGFTASADTTVYANFSLNTPPPPPPPPPVNSCANIAGPDAVAMQQYVARPGSAVECLAGLGDANGTLSFGMQGNGFMTHDSLLDFVTTAGTSLGEATFSSAVLNPLQQPLGVAAAGGGPDTGPYPRSASLQVAWWWSEQGPWLWGDLTYRAGTHASAADPNGGVFIAGDLSADTSYPSPQPLQHVAMMFSALDPNCRATMSCYFRWGPRPLAAAGPVFGVGVDVLGRSLVITGAGAGNITAQWFDRNGTPLTGEFTLLTGFTPGANTWFETSPLIGGGLVVRRMDRDQANGTTAAMLVTVDSGAASVHAAPAWMTSRPNTRLQIARGGKAYAVLPYGRPGVSCSERLEIVAFDGTSCGARDYPIAAGACTTQGLTLAVDGTVMQQLPSSMETVNTPGYTIHTCTWRFWTRAAQ